jgi:4-amino-4-deoxy-L-arabinose transferase-like glycosyltransferase
MSKKILELTAILLILALGAYLRLVNLGVNPGWYTDEGTIINIAANLAQGHHQYLAINQSMLLVARLPVFPYLLAGLFRIFGVDITVLRAFTGCLGVLSIGLLYAAVRRGLGKAGVLLALLAAGLLAVYPDAVLYNRLGYNYNLLTPLILLIVFGALDYLDGGRRRGLLIMTAALGIGLVSNVTMVMMVPPVIIVVLARRPRDLLWSFPLMLAPLGIYSGLMVINVPEAFLFDLRFTISRMSDVPLALQGPVALMNYSYLINREPWFVLAIIGLFLLRPARLRYVVLVMYLLPLLAISRSVLLNWLSFYYISPLLPFVAFGLASLVYYGAPVVVHTLQRAVEDLLAQWGWKADSALKRWGQARGRAIVGGLGVFIFLGSPILLSTISLFGHVQSGYRTALDPLLVNPQSARAVAAFLNAHSSSDQVVIASPAVAWLLEARATDFQQALAADGQATIHFPIDIPENRFVFDPRYEQASFVAIDGLWRNWAGLQIPSVARMMAVVEGWPMVFTSGDIIVYQNPLEISR